MVYRVGVDPTPTQHSNVIGTIYKWIRGKRKTNLWFWFGAPLDIRVDSSVPEKQRLVAIKQEVMDAVTDGISELFSMVSRESSVDKDILNAMRKRYHALSLTSN